MFSQQVIIPGADVVIIPIHQQSTYNAVELVKDDKEFSQYGFAHTSYYLTAFWGYAGRFDLDDTTENHDNLNIKQLCNPRH